MKKIIVSLALALTLGLTSSSTVFAATICSGSSDGVHHFQAHKEVQSGYTTTYQRTFLYAYGPDNRPIYETCSEVTYYTNCMYKCTNCSTVYEAGGTHTHQRTTHSSRLCPEN